MFAAIGIFLAISFSMSSQKPDICPWCKNDPKLLAAAGLVSHGPMSIAQGTSEEFEKSLPGPDWIFLESKHLRWAFSLGPQVVSTADKPRVDAELARLKKLLPTVPLKAEKLDPYLRLHILVMRSEEFYERFQRLLKVTDADFPASRQDTGPYMGNGSFLGEKGKYEVYIHTNRVLHRKFIKRATGAEVADSLRWHFIPEHKLTVSIPAIDELKDDAGLFPHVVHNLSHLFFCGYKHFSYDPPVWLDEGLAHVMEKEIDPKSMTFDGEEGSLPEKGGSSNWTEEARKIVGLGKAVTLPELIHKNAFGDLAKMDHIIIWSKVQFLVEKHPDALAKFIGEIKGQLDDQGYPSGKDIKSLQRKSLKSVWNWTPENLETEWRVWLAKPPTK